jgi:hypothetical protein
MTSDLTRNGFYQYPRGGRESVKTAGVAGFLFFLSRHMDRKLCRTWAVHPRQLYPFPYEIEECARFVSDLNVTLAFILKYIDGGEPLPPSLIESVRELVADMRLHPVVAKEIWGEQESEEVIARREYMREAQKRSRARKRALKETP